MAEATPAGLAELGAGEGGFVPVAPTRPRRATKRASGEILEAGEGGFVPAALARPRRAPRRVSREVLGAGGGGLVPAAPARLRRAKRRASGEEKDRRRGRSARWRRP